MTRDIRRLKIVMKEITNVAFTCGQVSPCVVKPLLRYSPRVVFKVTQFCCLFVTWLPIYLHLVA